MPAEREVSVHIEDGTSYTVTLYSGRLDVKALKESMADEGLVLRTLNGVVPAYDAYGMSRTVFNADIPGKTQAKTGEARPQLVLSTLEPSFFSIAMHKVEREQLWCIALCPCQELLTMLCQHAGLKYVKAYPSSKGSWWLSA